jgi:hypothetical protein
LNLCPQDGQRISSSKSSGVLDGMSVTRVLTQTIVIATPSVGLSWHCPTRPESGICEFTLETLEIDLSRF